MNMYLWVFPIKLFGKGRNIIPFPLRKPFPSDHKFLPRSTPPPLGLLFCLRPITLLLDWMQPRTLFTVLIPFCSFFLAIIFILMFATEPLFSPSFCQEVHVALDSFNKFYLYPYNILIIVLLIIPIIVYCYKSIQINIYNYMFIL